MLPYEPLDQYLDQQDREDDPDSYPGPDKEPGTQTPNQPGPMMGPGTRPQKGIDMKHTNPHKDRNKAQKDSRRLDLETWILLGIFLPLTIIILKAL